MNRESFWTAFSLTVIVTVFFGPFVVQDVQSAACKTAFPQGGQPAVDCVLEMFYPNRDR
jgi:hypothetical protein